MKNLMMAVLVWLFTAVTVKAQILTPVKWSYAAKKISKTEAMLFMKATMDEGWHVYSQTVSDGGPVKTTFTFPASADYAVVGKTIEPKPMTNYEAVFKTNVSYFANSVIFQQKVKLNKAQTTVTGTVEYMTCNDKQCLPPESVDFRIPVK